MVRFSPFAGPVTRKLRIVAELLFTNGRTKMKLTTTGISTGVIWSRLARILSSLSAESSLSSFSLHDQFGRIHMDRDIRDRIFVLTRNDKDGGRFDSHWNEAILRTRATAVVS